MFHFFSMLFDWSTFFSMLLEHIVFFPFFSMTPLSFCKITRTELSLDFGVYIFGGWMACFVQLPV
jgi:hypothetical protein